MEHCMIRYSEDYKFYFLDDGVGNYACCTRGGTRTSMWYESFTELTLALGF